MYQQLPQIDYMSRNIEWYTVSKFMFKHFSNLRKPRVSISQSSWLVNNPKHYTQLARLAMAPAGKRIVFTGGSGKAGRHVIPELLKRGHQVGNNAPSAKTTQC